jgi:hypothetical protein
MLQKYRADEIGKTDDNGAIPCYARWMGGPTLALVRNCPTPFGPRTVYVSGEPDTYFSIPAVCKVRGMRITGYITSDDKGYVFRAHTKHLVTVLWEPIPELLLFSMKALVIDNEDR